MSDIKTKRVKAFTLDVGDSTLLGQVGKDKADEITKISDVDKNYIRVEYKGGSLCFYGRRNFVQKVIN